MPRRFLRACANNLGTLLVKGPNVFKGYWRMPAKTAEAFTSDGFFNTGDIAKIDIDGYISIIGRSKDMIITGGLNVYPKEIETILDGLPGIEESAVIGVPDADFGEAVTAVIVRANSTLNPAAELTVTTIVTRLKIMIANFKIPKHIHFVAALPRNTMGKVQKNQLREQFANKQA